MIKGAITDFIQHNAGRYCTLRITTQSKRAGMTINLVNKIGNTGIYAGIHGENCGGIRNPLEIPNARIKQQWKRIVKQSMRLSVNEGGAIPRRNSLRKG